MPARDPRPGHPTWAAIALMVGVVVVIVALSALSVYG